MRRPRGTTIRPVDLASMESIGLVKKETPLMMIASPLVIQGFSNFLGLFQVIMTNPAFILKISPKNHWTLEKGGVWPCFSQDSGISKPPVLRSHESYGQKNAKKKQHSTWNLMVGRRFFPFGGSAYFRVLLLLVSGRVYRYCWWKKSDDHQLM